MTNQTEVFTKLISDYTLEGLTRDYKLFFLCEWLEDINFHSECAKAYEMIQQPERLEMVKEIAMLLSPVGWNYKYIFNGTPDQKFSDGTIIKGSKSLVSKYEHLDLTQVLLKGGVNIWQYYITAHEVEAMQYIQTGYRIFARLTEYGMENGKDWINFLQIINDVQFKQDQEAKKVSLAYERD